MSVELFDYVVDGRNMWEPCFGEGGRVPNRRYGLKIRGNQTLRTPYQPVMHIVSKVFE